MKHLIVYAHPDLASFNHAILETAVRTLQDKGHEVAVRDLYALGFNPVLTGGDLGAIRSGETPADLLAEQEAIRAADSLIFIYPVWWAGLPAILKGYIDRVFAYGFAYAYGADGNIEALLTGKKGLLISTHGAPSDWYASSGMHQALKMTSDTGILEFCGIATQEHLFFGSVGDVDDAARKEMLAQTEAKLQSLF
ncbi:MULTISPECIES: NAD(P)H-dependent oxidoreductase [Paenibacillus]|uniref:NAD(P)H-dependent oxidoreductase n=1 Tax=Paenibacillus TaxID=44249 RepID=UPI0022B866F1|nr:NAD(P)H-dependent oxidoreductase [Paenibacillus caseinilyticus]MCZ8520319.1 NAD(P)H-dependent oxidoreductase [Paenibacillus caseinilyticus]